MNSTASSSPTEDLESIHPANPPGDSGTLNGVAVARGRGLPSSDGAGSRDEAVDDGAVGTVPTTSGGLLVALLAMLLVAPAGLAAVRAFRDSRDLSHSAVTSSGASVHAAASPVSPPPALGAPAPPLEAPRDEAVLDVFDLTAELDKQSREPHIPAADGPAIEATKGALSFPTAANGHRVYFDGKVVGEPPAAIVVACGRHVVKVGSGGQARTMLVPCGESVVVSYP